MLTSLMGVVLPNDVPPNEEVKRGALTEIATLIVAGFLIVLCALTHAGILGHTDEVLDILAAIAVGAIFGVVPQLSSKVQVQANTQAVLAAHKRLDQAGIAPASDPATAPPTA